MCHVCFQGIGARHDDLSDDVFPWVREHLFLIYLSQGIQFINEGMIPALIAYFPFFWSNVVNPTITYMSSSASASVEIQQTKCSTRFFLHIGIHLFQEFIVRILNSPLQNLVVELFFRRCVLEKIIRYGLDDGCTSHLTFVMTAHSIANDEEIVKF